MSCLSGCFGLLINHLLMYVVGIVVPVAFIRRCDLRFGNYRAIGVLFLICFLFRAHSIINQSF